LAYRIHRSTTTETVLLALSGDMDMERATWLRGFPASGASRQVTLDLNDVTQFLVNAQAAGIRIVNCPDYVRTWMAAEADCQRRWTASASACPRCRGAAAILGAAGISGGAYRKA
jgi:hypothetical protein